MNVFDYFFDSIKDWEKPFIANAKRRVTFNSLYQNSSRLASFLSREVGSQQNILLVSPNSEYFITVYLAILKSGNVCIPLNQGTEQENLNYILTQTESRIIFSVPQLKLSERVPDSVSVLEEKDVEQITTSESPVETQPAFDPDRTAEIIFTSGSTGEPKGVMLSHGNIMANTDSIIEYLKLGENDRMCVVLPFFYCYGLSLLHTHLRVGGSLVLNNSFIFLGSVLNDLKNYRCTGFAGVPSHFQILLKKSDSFKTTQFPDLRYVTQAGGKLHDVFVQEFVSAFPKVEFYIMYGQTEATARLSYLPAEEIRRKPGSIGIPIPGVELKIIDSMGNPLPAEKEGELIARGKNIMKGYYRDEKETSVTLKDGWLHTGDIAREDADGYFYITARKKEIIKVGGKRVSPKEIEEVILGLPEVIDCTISAQEDPLLGESIKASIVLDKNHDEEKMRERITKHCSQHLALYKIPQSIEFLKSMELSATGKKIKQ
ncbi:class I adenylate-forming enzyme family protein [Muriicola marianensis]|uniref:Long-chain-fatty-acid--CoA ligase n=1 Tax=Muriicola marianensis TaxID=1324801 RepID=A0ABQ1QQR7_9FLAO|nr:AMP-binding protein [Muriicola marianensis]GGD41198.1 long-chain-fatty-acid--CoA ligase [Muriicola marianensis]